jgi:hypothetical protein
VLCNGWSPHVVYILKMHGHILLPNHPRALAFGMHQPWGFTLNINLCPLWQDSIASPFSFLHRRLLVTLWFARWMNSQLSMKSRFLHCVCVYRGVLSQILDEVSERNYFNRRMYRNHRAAFSELRRPAEYSKMSERFFDTGSKLGGLIFPGSSAHYMRNYVTAVQETPDPFA